MKTFSLLMVISSTAFVLSCGSSSTPPNPLVAQYAVSAPAGSSAVVQFGPDTNYGMTTSPATVPDGETSVTVEVAGMKAQSTYHMRAVTTLPDGTQQTDPDRSFTTGAVPSNIIPQFTVTATQGMTPSPGVELVGLTSGQKNLADNLTIFSLDPSGNLIWYYDYDHSLGLAEPIKLLPNGHFLIVLYVGTSVPGGIVREIDLAGNTIHEFNVGKLNTWLSAAGYTWSANSIHHDFLYLPNGHLILLVNSNKDFTNLTGYPGTTTVLGDSIIDLDPNYNVVWVWSTFDHLDVNRHPMLFPDWTHSNALVYSQDDGNLLLSMRHQSWVIKIDYENGAGTGDIIWKLGYQGDFTLLNSTSPADWFSAQHDANIASPNTTGDFQLALFDNGLNRVLDSSGTTCGSTGAAACYSRPAIFDVNETTMTAQLLWSYPTVFSLWGGVTQELPNTNMFADINTPSDNPSGARIVELTQQQTPQIVWELDVNGQNSYRTIHLGSLYPGVQW
ncbi:MAG: aryl-sulfate sulfotransferase [Candidatus Sulfotelmatobacter sp.]